MLLWDKTPSVSRLKIPSAEPHELDGSQSNALAGSVSKALSPEGSSDSDNQDRLMSGCWPDQPWVPRPTHLSLSWIRSLVSCRACGQTSGI